MTKGYLFYDDETQGAAQLICQIGFVLTDAAGNVLRTFQTLVNPHHSFDWYVVKHIHGINAEMCADAPDILDVWNTEIEPLLKNNIFVAHGAKSADLHHIRKSFIAAGAADKLPTMTVIDSNEMARQLPITKYGIAILASRYNISEENHHDALDDADVLRQVFFAMLDEGVTPHQFIWPEPISQLELNLDDVAHKATAHIKGTIKKYHAEPIDTNQVVNIIKQAKHIVITGRPAKKGTIIALSETAGLTVDKFVTEITQLVVLNEHTNPHMFKYIHKHHVPVTTLDTFMDALDTIGIR